MRDKSEVNTFSKANKHFLSDTGKEKEKQEEKKDFNLLEINYNAKFYTLGISKSAKRIM